MGDIENGEKERKTIFVTVGTTLFDTLLRAVDSWEVKQELLKRVYQSCHSDGSWILHTHEGIVCVVEIFLL